MFSGLSLLGAGRVYDAGSSEAWFLVPFSSFGFSFSTCNLRKLDQNISFFFGRAMRHAGCGILVL